MVTDSISVMTRPLSNDPSGIRPTVLMGASMKLSSKSSVCITVSSLSVELHSHTQSSRFFEHLYINDNIPPLIHGTAFLRRLVSPCPPDEPATIHHLPRQPQQPDPVRAPPVLHHR